MEQFQVNKSHLALTHPEDVRVCEASLFGEKHPHFTTNFDLENDKKSAIKHQSTPQSLPGRN